MAGLEGQFLNIQKKIRQIAVQKMQQKTDSAAEKAIKAADKLRDYDDVTGNLYRSTAIGTYYKGSLQSIHYTPGPEPTRLTLAAGERYNLDRYYRSSFSYKDSGRRAYRGQYGEGGESGLTAAEDALLYAEHGKSNSHMTWQMKVVAAVDYAQFVETKRGHDVITSLREYMVRYFRKM